MASPWLESARETLGSLKLKLALTGALIIGASVAVRREWCGSGAA